MLASRFWTITLCIVAGPFWFVASFLILAVVTLKVDPYPNAGAGMAVLVGALGLTFVLWIASVALIQNARDRVLRNAHDPPPSSAAVEPTAAGRP